MLWRVLASFVAPVGLSSAMRGVCPVVSICLRETAQAVGWVREHNGFLCDEQPDKTDENRPSRPVKSEVSHEGEP